MITVHLDAVRGRLRGNMDRATIERLRTECSYEVPNARFVTGYRTSGWDGTRSLYDNRSGSFPVGLWPRIGRLLKDRNIPHRLTHAPLPKITPQHLPAPGPEWDARPYQKKAVDAAMRNGRGMIHMATGGGKTVVAGHIMERLQMSVVFFVHTKDLLYQSIDAFTAMFGEGFIGQIGDGVVRPSVITVCTLQTMASALGFAVKGFDEDDRRDVQRPTTLSKAQARSFLDSVRVVFMDECHRVAAPLAQKVVQAARYPLHRYGLSASPWRDDGADIVLEGVFGEVITSISASALIQQKYLVPPYIRMLEVPARSYARGTPYDQVYSDYIVENDERNGMALDATESLIRRGRPTLVLVRRLAHGEYIREALALRGIDIPFLSGQDEGNHRRSVLNDLRGNKIAGMVATTIADEGLDIKPLSGLVLLAGGKSSTRALQRVGRALRTYPGKVDAEICDFRDNALYLYQHSDARERLYATEPGFTVLDI